MELSPSSVKSSVATRPTTRDAFLDARSGVPRIGFGALNRSVAVTMAPWQAGRQSQMACSQTVFEGLAWSVPPLVVQQDHWIAALKPRCWAELQPHQVPAYRDALCVERAKLIKIGRILDEQAAERGANVTLPVRDWCQSVQRHASDHWRIAQFQFGQQINAIKREKSAFRDRPTVRQYLTWLEQHGMFCEDGD